MDEGSEVTELFGPEQNEQWEQVADEIRDSGQVLAVVTPLTALELTHNLVDSESGNPAESVAGQLLLNATERDPSPEGQEVRTASSIQTLERISAIPVEERQLDNPEYVDFLLHDNEGNIRKALAALLPGQPGGRERHARADGRAAPRQPVHRGRGRGSTGRGGRHRRPRVRQRHRHDHRRGGAARATSTTTSAAG